MTGRPQMEPPSTPTETAVVMKIAMLNSDDARVCVLREFAEYHAADIRAQLIQLETTALEHAQGAEVVIQKLREALQQADDCLHALAKRYPTAVHEIYGDAEHETDAVLAMTAPAPARVSPQVHQTGNEHAYPDDHIPVL